MKVSVPRAPAKVDVPRVTPIMLSSGYNTQHLSQQLTGRGVAAFLQKPYEFSDLQMVARNVIETRAQP